jgi:arsenate reductase
MMKPRVLFMCTENSCRSQTAEGFLRHLAGDRFEVTSAGTYPTELDSKAVSVMHEVGIDISSQRAKDIAGFFGQRLQYVITVRKKAKERCPIFPGSHLASQLGYRGPCRY